MEISDFCCFLLWMLLSVEVLSQDPIELTDVRLYTEGGLLFGGAVEVRTPNGWERACYDGFNSQMADVICHKRGFDEGAMAVRSSASLGIEVNPLPSLACGFTTADGEEIIQCEYASTCSDHVVVICNYPGYLGCYRHTRNDPSLDEASFTRANMTVQLCLSLCRQNGNYLYAGVAFGQECYCEAQGVKEALVSRRLTNDECYLPCVGDPLQICGGGTAIGIYDGRLGSCDGVYTDAGGAIVTPGFPGKYSNDEQCTWSVRVADAANVTVKMKAVVLAVGDRLSVAAPQTAELVAFTGSADPSNIRFESASHDLNTRLEFTFTGGVITVTFNSTLTSFGSQGVVITFSSSIGPFIDPSLQINMTIGVPEPVTTVTTHAVTTTITSPLTATSPTTTIPGSTPSRDSPTTSLLTAAVTSDNNGTTASAATARSTATPRLFTMVSTEESGVAPSITAAIVIAVGIALVFLLILTAAVLFTTSRKHDHKRRHNNIGHVNAAYAMSNNDRQTDSGIFDPGYENADLEDPIYLSIRNDPRGNLNAVYNAGSDNHDRDSNQSLSRTSSVKTTKTDHDYQSVCGLSRENTQRSYISIYPDSKTSTLTGGKTSPIQGSPGTCGVAEDGYMVPTPKNSTQIQQTKL